MVNNGLTAKHKNRMLNPIVLLLPLQSMTQFDHDRIKPFSLEGSKKEQVSEMFDQIAPRYDFMNRFLSAGTDIGWRRKAINQFKKDGPKIILDVATGTGDMAIMAMRLLKPEKIVGIDISEKMLEIGRKRLKKNSLEQKLSCWPATARQ